MVRDDEERTSRRHALAPLDGEPPGRLVDDPRRAVTHSGIPERAVVHDETVGNVIRDWPDEPAHELDAQARRAADERLGALASDDLGDLTPLGEDGGGSRVRVCKAFEHGARISLSGSGKGGVRASAHLLEVTRRSTCTHLLDDAVLQV